MSLVILLCHGSRDRRATTAAHALADRAEATLGQPVRAAFLDHSWPTLPAAIGRELDAGYVGSIVVVPMLLTRAYHASTDIPAAVAAARLRHSVPVTVTEPIGPDARLLDAFDRQLPSDAPVVLAAAGTSSAHAQAEILDLADEWSRRRSTPVAVGYATQAVPSVGDALRDIDARTGRPAVVGTFVLFPGSMSDRIGHAAHDRRVTAPLCDSDDLLRVVADRVASLEPAK